MGKRAGRKGRAGGFDAADANARLLAFLRRQPQGVHHLRPPAVALDTALPAALQALYRTFDGGELCHEAIVLWPSSRVERLPADTPGVNAGLCLRIGAIDGDDLAVGERGEVYRLEAATGEWLPEGSFITRWLHGAVEAEFLLYDGDGEFVDEVFEDSGEPTPATVERMCRKLLARDRAASAPRWRLARCLVTTGRVDEAREQLEQVVAQSPDFPWAWFDLARISEGLGEGAAALEEMVQASECRPGYEHVSFLRAHAARLAGELGDDDQRARLARAALAGDPDLARAQRDGARAMLEQGEPEAALELARLAAALTPRDVDVLDVLARARSALEG